MDDTLIERLEAASEGSRELDCAIATALGWTPVPNPTSAGGLVGRWRLPDGSMSGHSGPLHYTVLLDAAMTLTGGWRLIEFCEGYFGGWDAQLIRRGQSDMQFDPDPDLVSGAGATGPLALCIAALKALRAQAGEKS